ncbi:hypothetical protein CYMTET_46409 [Cymbomonas tetramitiformis]|uniref:Uncharacterized protein n=1 Tax=Cymbomonas tetramitiformis TaxID=36881 RepID=A0AAE0BXF2_9CHLO|nr:hypothetical protein CYMTET_46409 [Cymbomonas tetramitiformis]
MSGVNFEDILGMTFFILMIWFVGRIFKAGNCSPIVGEIFVGVALGPNGLDIVPLFNDEDCAVHRHLLASESHVSPATSFTSTR